MKRWITILAVLAIGLLFVSGESQQESSSMTLEEALKFNEALKTGAKYTGPKPEGVVGTIRINKIGVELPIRYGTDDDVLDQGAGLLEGTPLPTGTKGNRTVISAHRGTPTRLFFTRLDELEEGDTFEVDAFGQHLVYEVSEIETVLPDDTSVYESNEDLDQATLLTCTPYGINSHRLLVTGVRVPAGSDQ